MTSKFKALTDHTPQLYSGADTEAKAQPSAQLASVTTVGEKIHSTKITPQPSEVILTTGKSVSEKSILAAQVLKAVLSRLEKDGLVKRYRLLSKGKDGQTTVKEIRIVFDNSQWTEGLELRLLSKEAKK
jgi:hypothetical protein